MWCRSCLPNHIDGTGIFTSVNVVDNMVNVGKYISPMDAMGKSYEFHFGHFGAVHRYYME